MNCYSTYHKNKIQCETCEIKDYCKESIYKSENNIVDLALLDNINLNKTKTKDITKMSSIAVLLSEMLHFLEHNFEEDRNDHDKLWQTIDALSKLYKINPTTYKIVLKKITNPNASYQEIANEMDLFKESVFYHIQKSKNVSDDLRQGFLIDSRWKKKEDR